LVQNQIKINSPFRTGIIQFLTKNLDSLIETSTIRNVLIKFNILLPSGAAVECVNWQCIGSAVLTKKKEKNE